MGKIKELLRRDPVKKLIKFGATGVLNTLVDYAAYTLCAVVFGWNIYLAQTLGYAAGVANSYAVNRSWTFRSERTGFFSIQLVKFLLVNLVTYGISLAALYLFADRLGMHKLIAKLLVTAVTVLVNFVLSNLWVFRKRERD